MRSKRKYVTYNAASSAAPRIDSELRRTSRYGGVGVIASDDLDDSFDPDEPFVPDDVLRTPSSEVALPQVPCDSLAVDDATEKLPIVPDALPADASVSDAHDADEALPPSCEDVEGESALLASEPAASPDSIGIDRDALVKALGLAREASLAPTDDDVVEVVGDAGEERPVEDGYRAFACDAAPVEFDGAATGLSDLAEPNEAAPIEEPHSAVPSGDRVGDRIAGLSGKLRSEGAAVSSQEGEFDRFAQFKNVYESRDGKLCVFEDEAGHIVAVNAKRLA